MQKLTIVILLMVSFLNAQKNMTLATPPYLKKGDTIAILAPAGILLHNKQVIVKAKKLVESWGLHAVLGKHVFAQANHFAGSDMQRFQDFQQALDDSKIKAIWCARGGYGSIRILDKLDFTKFKKNPKWIIGYSDVTVFHNHIHNLGIESLHAMMGISLQDEPESMIDAIQTFKNVLFNKELKYKIKSSNFNKNGNANGQLVGGNISILAAMLGSESQISTNGKILFIEEIGEYKYAIDRLLQSLKRAGSLDRIKGLIVGRMTNIRKNTIPWGTSIEQLILDVVPTHIPVIFDFPAGHEPDNRALILGREVEINVNGDFSNVSFK